MTKYWTWQDLFDEAEQRYNMQEDDYEVMSWEDTENQIRLLK